MTSTGSDAKTARFGLIGLGVMGENLALNVEEHGFPVAVWNRTTARTERFIGAHPGKKFIGARTLEEFVSALERPRQIFMLVKAGKPVDEMIDKIRPLVSEGDILIDGGNSYFEDTRRRERELKKAKLNFFGTGVSGGEEGARYGPSLMPGGPPEAYEHMRSIFESIAAKTDSGACVTHVGPDGAGHFVKMVHNGIEYGDMQLIAEAYDLLRRVLGLEAGELAGVFTEWNRGPLQSFLIEITAQIFGVKDPESGRPLVDLVQDKAGQKGTGQWTAQVALDLGVPTPTLAVAVNSRLLSAMKEERVAAEKKLGGPRPQASEMDRKDLIAAVHDGLRASKICCYAQGMSLIGTASRAHEWNIGLSEMARIWKGGCIIRARLLDSIMRAYERRRDLPNLMMDAEFAADLQSCQQGWRRAVMLAQERGVPVPAMSASLAYYDSYRTSRLPQNLTQAQRDAFGAHTYERTDHPERGFVHTEWLKGSDRGRGEAQRNSSGK
ncbi:MAG: NADP-dependent phosphogluconate dehydrogenase [Acidobacteriota bacterium]